MVMSPARRNRQRILASRGSAPVPPPSLTGSAATEYQMVLIQLGEDLRRLKQIASQERKIDLKRDLLPAYDAWIAGVLEADARGAGGAQDEIVTHMLIWRIDIGDFAGALPLAEYVLRHNLTLPERFSRTAATLIAELTAETAFKAFGQDQDFDRAILMAIDDLTEIHDMPDQVRAKLEKAIGTQLARDAEQLDAGADGPAGMKRGALEQALRRYRRAFELDDGAGVKKEMQRLEREINKLKGADAPAAAPDAFEKGAVPPSASAAAAVSTDGEAT